MKIQILCRIIVVLAVMGVEVVFAQNDNFVTISTVRSRNLAMGGATTAIEDDLGAIDFNPAAFRLYKIPKKFRITVFLNPLGFFTSAVRHDEVHPDIGSKFQRQALGLGLGLKGLAISARPFSFAFFWGEEMPGFSNREYNRQAFQLKDYFKTFSNSFVAKIFLAEQVSFGVAADLIHYNMNDGDEWAAGFSYGILLQPDSGLNVGLVYHDLPNDFTDARLAFDRVVDETINLGFSYNIFTGTWLSADIRNISEEQKDLVREIHGGIEQNLFSFLALRGGYYRDKLDKADVLSCGIGLFDLNSLFKTADVFNHQNYALNYAFILKKGNAVEERWHYLSFMIRL